MKSYPRKPKDNRISHRSTREIPTKISFFLSQAKRKSKKWMEGRAERLNAQHWAVMLGLFVLLAGGYSGSLLLRSAFSDGKIIFSITSIQKPEIGGELTVGRRKLSERAEKQYPSLLRFHQHVDSLQADPTATLKCDRIILYWPAITDSLNWIERDYPSQKLETLWNNNNNPKK